MTQHHRELSVTAVECSFAKILTHPDLQIREKEDPFRQRKLDDFFKKPNAPAVAALRETDIEAISTALNSLLENIACTSLIHKILGAMCLSSCMHLFALMNVSNYQ